jgi:tetratricopeptide (TPR) repeat protein
MKSVLYLAFLALSTSGPWRTQTSNTASTHCTSDPKTAMTERAKAAHLVQSGHVQQAVDAIKRAYDLCPSDSGIARILAEAEVEAGDPASAEQLLRDMLAKHDSADLHDALGETLKADGRNREAAEQFQIAAKMEPSESHIFDFGTTLMRVNFSAAQKILEYGVKTFPSSVKIRVALAVTLYAQDRGEEGARLLCAASDLDPADVHPMEVLADTRDVPKAVQNDALLHLDNLRRQYPDDGLILFDYAMVKSGRWSGDKTANPPDLEPLLKGALRLNPNLPKAYFELALILGQQEDHKAEIAALQRASALDPKAEQFHYRLAFAYRSDGNMADYKLELARYKFLHSASHAPH